MAYATLRSLEVDCALCCDSVRKEDNGKLILVGIYQQDVLVTQFPAKLTIQFYAIGRFIAKPQDFVWLRLLVDDQPVYSVKVSLYEQVRKSDWQANPHFNMVLPPAEIAVEEPSNIRLEARDREHDDWQTIVTVPVKQRAEGAE